MPERLVREAVTAFDDLAHFEAAVDDLLNNGFDRAELSLVARDEAVAEKLGHIYRRVEEVEDDPDVPRKAFVSEESVAEGEGALMGILMYVPAVIAGGAVVASGGALFAALGTAGLAAGAGGIVGAMLAEWLGEDHADYIRRQLDRGGLLLWVNLRDREHEAIATRILKKHSKQAVHVHSLPV
jgi:hypothetical protein